MTNVPQRIAALSPEKRELLLQRLKIIESQEQDVAQQEKGQAPPLRVYDRTASTHFPLSFAQQRLWFLDQLEPGSTAYLLPRAYQLCGLLDIQCLEKSLEELVRRHESLRTTFAVGIVPSANSEPVQVIHPMGRRGQAQPLYVIDLQWLSQEERVAQHRRLAIQEARHPCDLEKGPLLRFHLLRLTSEEHILLLTLHHIVSDGWSMEILVRELSEVYSAFIQGHPPTLSALPIQYADYALWQRQWLQGEVLQKQLDYWKQQLVGAPPMLNLPTDRPRPAVQTSEGAWQSLLLPSELLGRLKSLSLQENVTLFMMLLAAFQVLLMRYSGQQDIVVGIPTANRIQGELERLIGFFSNTLALRTDLSGNPSFRDLLSRMREVAFEVYAHQDMPFEKLVEELRIERDLSRHPLFQVFFTLQNTPFSGFQLPGISCNLLEPEQLAARFDLSLMLVEMENGLLTIAEYNTDLFDEATITRLLSHWRVLLEAIVRDPGRPIETLPLLTESEMHRLLVEWNNTARNIPHDLCLHQLIEQQVEQTPDAIAVIFERAGAVGMRTRASPTPQAPTHNPHVLTYGELNAQANQLAHCLREIGIGPDKLVAVCMERSLELVVALFAILKAGGGYLPLDPDYPAERQAWILADAQPTVVLTQQRFLARLPNCGQSTLCFESSLYALRHRETLAEDRRTNLVNTTLSDQIAYVIYTSGSTGTPKGVMVSHHNVVNFLRGMDEHIGESTPGIWLAVTSISFDISILELFWTLTRGFQVVLHAGRVNPESAQGTRVGARHRTGASPARPYSAARHFDRLAPLAHVEKEIAFSLFYFASDAADAAKETANSYQLLLEGAKFADQHGFQALWTPERHFHEFGGLYPNPSVTSAAVAAVTQRIHIRAGSVVLPLHNPIRVAEEWAVVDNLSCGRVGVAFASGWHANDFVFAPDKYAQRREIMQRDIEMVRKLWRGETITVQGGAGQSLEVKTLPRPVQVELPVWLTSGGIGTETFRIAGKLGVNILTHLLGQDLDQLAAKISVYREAWHRHGHDAQGKTGHVTLMIHTFIGTDLEMVRETVRQPFRAYLKSSVDLLQRLAQSQGLDINADTFHEDDMQALLDHAFERYFESSGLMGTVDSCLPMIENLKAIGVDELACLIDFGVAVDDVLTSLQHLEALKECSKMVTSGTSLSVEQGTPEEPRTPAAQGTQTTEGDISLSAQLLEYGVSHLQCTPSLMNMVLMDPLASTALKGLSHILLGGEELPLALIKQIQTWTEASPVQLHNMYGPTETTIWSTTSVIESGGEEVSLGDPIANTQVYLLDAHLQPVPIGVAGEIYIGGEGLARGYLNQPGLTAEKFLPSPFVVGAATIEAVGTRRDSGLPLSGGPCPMALTPASCACLGERLYRTGDMARYKASGQLEYLGRRDQQIKLRGYRIELGEIEASLQAHPAIHEAVVVLRSDSASRLSGTVGATLAVAHSPDTALQKRLIAYAVTESEERPTRDDLHIHLRRQLPEYMVPANIVFLGRLPLTPNGKIDRKALSVLEGTGLVPALHESAEIVPPQTPMQEQLALIWVELLHLPQVSIHSNFFELGGHSLLAAQLMLRIQTAFEVKVLLRSLFEAPTVAEMAGIIERMQNEVGKQERSSKIAVAPRKRDAGAIPLSFAQERLWFLDQLAPDSARYVVSQPFHLSGLLHVKALERSLTAVVQRHEILRTTFSSQEGQPVQVIAPDLVLQVPVIDLSGLLAAERDQQVRRLAQQDAFHPFDLSVGPLLRVQMLRLALAVTSLVDGQAQESGASPAPTFPMAPQEHVLLFTLHHIISDGKWSMGILLRELSALYQAELQAKPSLLPALPIQYADYAVWQRQWLQGEILEGQLAYWQQQLSGAPGRRPAPSLLELPTDRPRPAVQTDAGSKLSLLLSPALLQELKRVSLRAGATLFMTLLAAFQVLLMRYSGQQDIVVGTPIAGRGQAGLENLIGFFVNTLVLRSDLSGNPSFRQLLTRVREVALQAYAHQDLPFEKLVESLQVERSLSHSPLFQVFFALQNVPDPDVTLAGITFRQLEREHSTTLFDLSLVLIEKEGGLLTEVEYSTDLFNAATITRLLNHWQVLLEAIVSDPEQSIETLPLLTSGEREQLLVRWNATARDFPSDLCLHQLIEQQVERTPEAIAVVFEEQQVTYQQLNDQANQLAHRLLREGIGPDVLIGVCMERSLELVVALLAVLKAGGAYVPLDPNYPQERLTFLLADARVPFVLTQDHLRDQLFPITIRTICVELEACSPEHADNPNCWAQPENLAYLIYTSGSTGKPKGAMNTHRGICNRLLWMQSTYQLTPSDRVLQKTPFSFDVSVWEFFWPLMTGACLIIARPEGHQDPTYLRMLIAVQRVTMLHFVPSMLQAFLRDESIGYKLRPENYTSLRQVVCSGEALSLELQAHFFAHVAEEVQLHNLYGPTEAAIDVTFWQCQRAVGDCIRSDRGVPIGHPIANTQIYLLDKNLLPVPIGITGEVYIGGVNLARGYWNRADLTAERFVPHPFVGTGSAQGTIPTAPVRSGERLYRSGDLARYRPDGAIEYLGRIDQQVKLRGFRIELGEIEATLRAYPAVQDAVVVLQEESEAWQYLVAYVVPRTGESLTTVGAGQAQGTAPTGPALQGHLREQLPDYMVPTRVVFLETMPLTPNGKVDRKALPVSDRSQFPEGTEIVAPQTPLQEQLALIWADLLFGDNPRPDKPQVGIHQNFFELGGHSLLATQLMARIRTLFHVEVPLRRLFETPTIADMAFAIEQIQTERIEQEESEKVAKMFTLLGGLSEEEMQEVFTEEI